MVGWHSRSLDSESRLPGDDSARQSLLWGRHTPLMRCLLTSELTLRMRRPKLSGWQCRVASIPMWLAGDSSAAERLGAFANLVANQDDLVSCLPTLTLARMTTAHYAGAGEFLGMAVVFGSPVRVLPCGR